MATQKKATTSTVKKKAVSQAIYKATEKKTVDQLIAEAVKSAGTMRTKVQQAAIAVLMHAAQHGDYTKANDLVEGIGHGVKGSSLVEWFQTYGGLTKADGDQKFTGWKGAEYIRNNFQKAKDKMWSDCSPDKPWQGFDLEAALRKALSNANAANKKIIEAQNKGDTELVEQLKSVVRIDQAKYDALVVLLGGAPESANDPGK